MAGRLNARLFSRVLLAGFVLVGAGFGIYRMAEAMMTPGQDDIVHKHHLTHTVARVPLTVSLKEQGTLESSENVEIICKVRGENIITSVVENGAYVKEGDVILTLDSLYIDEQISERSKYAHWSRSGAEHWRATANYRQLKVAEYLEGRYVTQVMSKELERVLKESSLLADNKMLAFNMQQFEKGYVSKDYVDQIRRQIDKNVVDLDLLNTDLKVLKEHTKKSEMARLEGELKVAQAQFEASDERAEADASRRDRAVEEKAFCTILAPKDGLVIHPRAASWKWAPDIVIGGSVYKEQVLLLMPDLDQMQVKIGVEEEVIDNIWVGMKTIVTLPGREPFDAKVSEVADIARPPIIGSGDVVRYDVIVALPKLEDLKPGTSAKLEIVMNELEEVLTIPVAAKVEIDEQTYCWVETKTGVEQRLLETKVGDDVFVVVTNGVHVGEKIVMNPLLYTDAPQDKDQNAEDDTVESEVDPSIL
ncbi:MAG: efflux RND transporter periplasmic adaptor subunit [Pirellulales bacterium]|nr:efflux RND transporter periplasmic adaptor subunit [Pirellulales bacterium]